MTPKQFSVKSRYLTYLLICGISLLLPQLLGGTTAAAEVDDSMASSQLATFWSSIDIWLSYSIGGVSVGTILVDIAKFLVGTIAIRFAWKFIHRGFHFLTDKSDSMVTRYGRNVQLGSKEIVQVEQIRIGVKYTLLWLKRGCLVLAALLYANFVLSILPQTRELARTIFESAVSSFAQLLGGIISYLPKLFFLIILVVIGYYLFRFINFFFREIENGDITIPGFDLEWAQPTARIAQILALSLLAVVAFPYLPGSGSEAFRGVSILLGVLFSIGSSSVVSNLIAGILLTYTRAFRIGDDIEVQGVIGTVIEKGPLVVRIRNYSNQFVSIPNSAVLSNNVLNFRINSDPAYTSEPPPIICVKVCLPYEYPWEKVHEVLLAAAAACPEILIAPAPEIFHLDLQPSYVEYELNAYSHKPTLQVITQLKQCIRDKFDAAGMEMIAPQYVKPHLQNDDLLPAVLRPISR